MRNIFIDVAIAAFVLFVILYLVQIHRLRNGNDQPLGGFRVFINWVLLLLVIVGVGGAIYSTANPSAFGGNSSKKVTKSDDSYQVTNKSTASDGKVTWTPKTIRLNSDDEAKITFNIPKKTKIRLIGHRTGNVYKVLKARSKSYTKVVKLSDAGKYDVEITKSDGTQVVKRLVVHDQKQKSSESSSSSQASSSSAKSSSSRSSSNKSSNSNRNNSGSSTGSSRASGGYSGGGYRYNGGGSSYRPSYSGSTSSNTSTNSGSSSVYNGRGYAPAGQ